MRRAVVQRVHEEERRIYLWQQRLDMLDEADEFVDGDERHPVIRHIAELGHVAQRLAQFRMKPADARAARRQVLHAAPLVNEDRCGERHDARDTLLRRKKKRQQSPHRMADDRNARHEP